MRASPGSATVPADAVTVKPSPDSDSACARATDQVGASRRGGEQHAELVAAHAEGLARLADLGELGAEALEQQVARRVAERVVVGLEAVEVEEREHGRVHLVLGEPALELGDQRAAVAEPGQRVGRRLGRLARSIRPLSRNVPPSAHDDGEQGTRWRPRPQTSRAGRSGRAAAAWRTARGERDRGGSRGRCGRGRRARGRCQAAAPTSTMPAGHGASSTPPTS